MGAPSGNMSRLDASILLDSPGPQIETRSDKNPTSQPGNVAPPAWFRYLLPSVTDLIFIILVATTTGGILAPRLLGDASIGWHIRNGELMLRSHSITRMDPFSVTMNGQTWYAWEWLYDVAIAGIHHWLGLNGVVFFTAVIIAATFALTLRLSLRRGADLPLAAILLALSMGASMIHLFARPHVLSWLFTVMWFQFLDSSESGDGSGGNHRLWPLPVLMLLWANLHGGFVLGFVLLGIYLASSAIRFFHCRQPEMRRHISRRLQELGVVTAGSLAASLVNPYGYRLHVHVFRYLSSRWLMNHIDEFLSPDFHGVAQQCFVLILLITIVGLAVGRKPPLAQVLVLLFAIYSGLYSSRNVPVSSLLLTLVVVPLLTQAVAAGGRANSGLSSSLQALFSRWNAFGLRRGGMELNLRGHAWPLVAAIAGLLACSQGGRLGSHQWMDAHFDAKRFPVEASEVIAQRGIREPIFAPDFWGGYLIYRLYPQTRVFVDDRHDFYGEEFLKNYLKAIRLAPDWDSFLNDKRVNWALLPAGSSLANMLELTSQWRVVYRDGTGVLLERTTKFLAMAESLSRPLELVVGVNVESQDDTDFNRLFAAQGGTELPGIERGQDLAGHDRRGGLDNPRSSQQSGAVEHTFNHEARLGQSGGQVRTHRPGRGEVFSVAMGCRGGIGKRHHCGQRGRDVNGVNLVTLKPAVEIECAARARSGNDRDVRPVVSGDCLRTCGSARLVCSRTEAGQGDNVAAAFYRNSGHRRVAIGSGAGAAGAGVRRNSATSRGIGPGPGAFFPRS